MCLLFFAVSANAATLTVTTTNDAGAGSLRQALIDATTNAEANDIVFAIPTSDPNYDAGENRFTITLLSALTDIPVAATNITNSQLQGVTIMGNNTFRIFTLVNSAVVVMTNLTLSNGGGQGITANGDGGAIYMGDSGTLTLDFCTVANSSAASRGGGIFMNNSGTIHMNRSSIRGNNANFGGAMFINTSGTLNVYMSTLSGNTAFSTSGGAIDNRGTITAVNNTFSGNTAALGDGGAIANFGTMTLSNSTVVGNHASYGGGLINFMGAATLHNNIIALNTAVVRGLDLQGDFTGTYNLIGIADDSWGLTTTTNLWGDTEMGALDPMIGPLQNNGGYTFTHALLIGSPALDQGNSPTYLTDQRGYTRPYDDPNILNAADGSDIGAFEMLAPSSSNVSIGGRFLSSYEKGGRGISGVTVSLADQEGNVRTATTNAFGYYVFSDVQTGQTYIASATHKLYKFETKMVDASDEITDLNWTPTTPDRSPSRTVRTTRLP